MLVLSLLIACQSPPVALVPSVGDGLAVHELTPIDAAARRAFAARPGALDDATVRARYDAARANGLGCALTELECLVQVGVVVGAEQVVLVRARPGGVTLAVVDVTSARWLRKVEAPLGSDLGASLQAALTALDGAPPWVEPDVATSAPPSAPTAGSPLVAIGAGSGVALLGAAAVAVGAWPFLQASSAGAGLTSLDAEARDVGTAREGYATDVADTRAVFDAGKTAWDGWGQPLVVVGAAFVGIGAGVVAGALLTPAPGVAAAAP
ncbi:MAG: hypothetical protein HYS27_24175 [Deltaproteobacteria bacterium]|nr:hypothetical protein [Deltaproteobacteria bacterium]